VTVLSLGAAVLLQDRKGKLNRIFFFFNLAIAVWFFGTFMMFSSTTDEQVLFWDRVVYGGVSFIPAFLYHMSFLLIRKRPPIRMLIATYIASTTFFLISRTDYFIDGVFQYEWGAHAKAQLFHHLFLVYFALVIVGCLFMLFRHYRSATPSEERERSHSRLIFVALLILAVFGSLAYLPAYNVGVYPLSLLSGVAFSSILTYAITKYSLFDMKIIAAQVFVFFMWIISFVNIFLAESDRERTKTGALFIAVSGFGALLLKSMFKEVHQKEQLATLNTQLADLNQNLEAKVQAQTVEIRRAYEVEKRARKELEELDKRKTDFILTTQHHLRTPLTIVNGVVTTLAARRPGDAYSETDVSYLEKGKAATQRLIKLINEFLDISQMEVGKSILSKKETFMHSIVEEVLRDVSYEIEQKNIQVHTSFSDEARGISLFVDPVKIKDGLANIFDNAVKYTPSGGVSILRERFGCIR
jgi:signal transduction histidine kinase